MDLRLRVGRVEQLAGVATCSRPARRSSSFEPTRLDSRAVRTLERCEFPGERPARGADPQPQHRGHVNGRTPAKKNLTPGSDAGQAGDAAGDPAHRRTVGARNRGIQRERVEGGSPEGISSRPIRVSRCTWSQSPSATWTWVTTMPPTDSTRFQPVSLPVGIPTSASSALPVSFVHSSLTRISRAPTCFHSGPRSRNGAEIEKGGCFRPASATKRPKNFCPRPFHLRLPFEPNASTKTQSTGPPNPAVTHARQAKCFASALAASRKSSARSK